MNRTTIVAALVTICGCTERVVLGDEDKLPGLIGLEVSPPSSSIAFDVLAPPPHKIRFTAAGSFADGTSRDVTTEVTWSTDNEGPGSFVERGTYTTSGAAAGHVTIHAGHGEISGTARVIVTMSVTLIDSTFPPPANVNVLFAPGTLIVENDPIQTPAIRYPANGTMFPQGLSRTLFQHIAGRDNDAFRITFDSDVLHLTVLTGGDRWEPGSEIWALIARSHPGAQLTLGLDGADSASPGTAYRSSATKLRFSRTNADGVLYYFSDSTDGVVQSSLAAASASSLALPGAQCVGCHAISRDGTRIAFGAGGEKLATADIVTLEAQITTSSNIPMGWAAFSPDGQQLLVANKGVLTLRDPVSGNPIGPNGGVIPLPPQKRATHPDWAPDGTSIAVTLAAMADNNMDIKGGSIAVISYGADGWGAPVTLVTSSSDNDNNFFPRWSPDGRFLAYVHAQGPSRRAKTAELRLIAAAGGAPTTLRIASHRVASTDDVPDLASTMPFWAPGSDDVAWLAFASERPYGIVRPALGDSQIWIAGIDLAPSDGVDPSFAAFWLPSQDITALATNPIWAPAPRSSTE